MDSKMENLLQKFAAGAAEIFGPRMKSLVLYGSQASGESTRKRSDYNLLLIVEGLTRGDLDALGKITGKFLKRNPPPLVFSSKMFYKSTDVFPMEFLDIKENHRILAGSNPFHEMTVDSKNLRHQIEFELKGKLLKLRQGYILAAGKPAHVRELLIGSVSTFLTIFKSILRLAGQTPPQKKTDSLEPLAHLTGINPEPFKKAFRMKEGDRDALKLEPLALFDEYLDEIVRTVDFVDDYVVK